MSNIALALTVQDVRESVAVARSHGEKFFEQIVWQVENEAWLVLGYESWDAMRAGEYADMGVVAPRADRPELVARMRAKGLTQAEIAGTLGVSVGTVNAEVKFNSENDDAPQMIVNSRGQERPATYKRTETTKEEFTEEIAGMTVNSRTGEVISQEPTGLDGKTYKHPDPKPVRRKSLVDDAIRARHDLWAAVTKIQTIMHDDRYQRNKADIQDALHPATRLAREVISDLFDTTEKEN